KSYIAGIKSTFLFLISNLLFLISPAQWYDPEKVNPKAAELHEQAYGAAQEGKYEEAITKITKAVAMDPKFVDAFLSRAGMYANLKKYDSSVIDFEKSLALDSVYAATFLLPYSISLAGTGQFEKA